MAKTIALRSTLLMVLAVLALNAASDVAGTWDCAAITPEGEAIKFVLKLEDQSGQISGTISDARGEAKLGPIKHENSTITFKVDYDGAMYTLELKITGDSLAGTYRGEPATGEVKGKRKR